MGFQVYVNVYAALIIGSGH